MNGVPAEPAVEGAGDFKRKVHEALRAWLRDVLPAVRALTTTGPRSSAELAF